MPPVKSVMKKQVKKQSIKQWVFEGSQRPLHEYLLVPVKMA